LHNAWSRWRMDNFDTLYYNNGTSDSWKSALNLSSANDYLRLRMYSKGLYGQNMIVGDDDTGCDWDNIYFRDPSGTKPVYDKDKDRDCESTGSHRKLVAYNVHADTFDLSSSGHGSHTTGSVAADSLNSGLPSATAFARVMGMAPLAKLAFTDIGGTGDALVLPTNYADIYEWAYDAGARIHTSSWGQSSGGYSNYTANSQQLDSCAWRNKDYMMFRSAGNSNLDRDSVNTPATAKNIVCVGATESGFGSATTTWAVNGGATRNELNDVAEFSSHGPTKEGMMRPDVCGSGGWYIWSVDSDGNLASNNAGITYMGGTSMSTPTTAGFGALVRQYFTEGWYPSGAKNAADAIAPSGALIKAMIINSTRNSNGAYSISTINNTGTQSAPSQGQGWGRATMADAIFFAGDVRDLKVWDITSGFTSAGQYHEYTITTGPSTTEYTKIVLTWVDYPANTGVTSLVVNDLNLTVTVNGNTYLGNVFGTTARSITGGSADTKNVTEVVWLDATPGQTITIRVTAAAVPYGPQPYALVATGDFITAAKINYKKSVILDSPTPVLVDAKLNNGEISDFNLWISNNTGASQTISSAKLREGSTYITNLDSLGSYGTVANNDSAYSVYRFSVASNTPDGTSIPCTLFVAYGTKVDTNAFALTVSGTSIATTNKDSLYYYYSAPVKSVKTDDMWDTRYLSKASTTEILYVKNTDATSVKSISVTNATVKHSATWVKSVTPTTGTVAVGDSLGIKVIVDPLGLTYGATYRDTLLVYTDADFTKAVTLQVPLILQYGATASFESSVIALIENDDCELIWNTNGIKNWSISRSRNSNEIEIIANVSPTQATAVYKDFNLEEGNWFYRVGYKSNDQMNWSMPVSALIIKVDDGISLEKDMNKSFIPLKLSISKKTTVKVSIYDMTGRLSAVVADREFDGGVYRIVFDAADANLSNGIYYIKAEINNKSYTEKFTIVR
ncbi:MAG: S8 family serine peptidase, partial [bacterium]|nr:S8 family serine peptidase [bacterium]